MKSNIPALGLAVAVGLAACGGGELFAILQIVTPLGGAWSTAGSPPPTTLQFTSPSIDTQVFSSKFDVAATISSDESVCGAISGIPLNLVGSLDNGKVVLRPAAPAGAPNCIDGTFTNLRRLDAVALGSQPARAYTNGRVDVQLQRGLWVSESGTLTLKFDDRFEAESADNYNGSNGNPVSGCNVSNLGAKVAFEGELRGFEVATSRRPVIPALVNPLNAAERYFTQVEFVDGSTLRLVNAGGQLVTLKRQRNPNNVVC